MQNCLNEEASYLYKRFTKHPWILVLLILIVLSGITILVTCLLCNIKYQCTYQQQDVALYFGTIICLLSAIFIGLPCILRFILNCIWYNTTEEQIRPVVYRHPLSSKRLSETRSQPRSNSKEKQPPSPRGPSPKHASKSFKEFYSEV